MQGFILENYLSSDTGGRYQMCGATQESKGHFKKQILFFVFAKV